MSIGSTSFLDKLGVVEEDLLRPGSLLGTIVTVPQKGLVLELFLLYKKHNLPWQQLSNWMKQLYGDKVDVLRKDTLLKSFAALHTKKSKLGKSVSNAEKLSTLLEEPYELPRARKREIHDSPINPRGTTSDARGGIPSTFIQDSNELALQTLANEVKLLKNRNEELLENNNRLLKIVQLYKPHNVRRRERRKEFKLKELRTLNINLKKRLHKFDKAIHKSAALYSRIHYSKTKCAKLANNSKCIYCSELEEKNKQLKEVILDLQEAIALAQDRVASSELMKFSTFQNGKYSDAVRACVMELLTNNVPVRRVEPVMASVLKMVDIDYSRLPKHTTVNEILIEARALSQLQLAEQLTTTECTTLHSDGTSKFGHHYMGYQVSTEKGTFTLGLQEVQDGSAVTMLDTLKSIVCDIEQTTACSENSATEIGKKIIAQIKSTMSDRASSQKSFNCLLEQYRTEVLPSVTSNWTDLSSDEQESMTTMYHFFCGVHLIANMADYSSEALRLFEGSYKDDIENSACSESGPVRLIRLSCKAFERRGDEKSGHPLKFATYLRRHGIHKVPLAHFKGNRFNILFHNAGGIYFLRHHIHKFLTSVWGASNQLLKVVLSDIKCPFNISGCKALGLINKFITTPLWRLLESTQHILDVPELISDLQSFLHTCTQDVQKVMEFIQGEYTPYPGVPVKKDEIWECLVDPSSDTDPLVLLMLQAIFRSLAVLITRFTDDSSDLPYDRKTEEETKSVGVSNIVSERDFAQLDHLIRQKPSATILSLEAHILFVNNKTSAWLRQKTAAEREELLSVARSLAPSHRRQFRERLSQLRKQREEALQKKQLEAERKAKRLLQEKEKLTAEIVQHGLWQTREEVECSVARISGEGKKKEAIKSQLRFRKCVLDQKHSNKAVYAFSKKGTGQYSSSLLKQNLLKLIESATELADTVGDGCCSMPTVPQQFKVGTRISHKFIVDDLMTTFTGKIISQVIGFPEWFNIVYDEEVDLVYTFKLAEDLNNGDLTILSD